MSYILEALTRSQRIREQNRLSSTTPVIMPFAPTHSGWWHHGSILLSMIALLMTGYSAWSWHYTQQVRLQDEPTGVLDVKQVDHSDSALAAVPVPHRDNSLTTILAEDETTYATSQILVVPAPRADGQPLPRGAAELRQALLSQSAPASSQSETESVIPDDLRADIELFKREVRHRQSQLPSAVTGSSEQAPTSRRAMTDDAALPSLNTRIPRASISTLVYHGQPQQRFLYLNGIKLYQGQQLDNGLQVVDIQPNGAIVAYQGTQFYLAFQH
jgi:hypothetical protein